jgi:hypothetical protein
MNRNHGRGNTQIIGKDTLGSLKEVNTVAVDGGAVGIYTKTSIASLPVSAVQAWSNKLRILDMNGSNGGVARGTTVTNAAWVTIYSYSGTGYVAGCVINLETFTDWEVRILIDGMDILIGSSGISSDDIQDDTIYDLDDITDTHQSALGLSKGSHDRIVWTPPLNIPIYFSSTVSIQIKREAGKASKKFQAGLMFISKET